MRSDYKEKKENRIERYENAAKKAAKESTSAYNRAGEIGSRIPFGQPIMVGHHSEKRHRRDIKKIDNSMRKSCELDKKAKYYENKAEAAEENNAISSDNPDAISELETKLSSLQRYQEMMKSANKVIRKWRKENPLFEVPSKSNNYSEKLVKLLEEIGIKNQLAIDILSPNCYGGIGFEGFQLTNNNATIRNTKKRIEQLKKRFSMKHEEVENESIRIVKNVDENRVQIFFDGKPDAETRTRLKRNGFRWTPSIGAWQAYLSNHAFETAQTFMEE